MVSQQGQVVPGAPLGQEKVPSMRSRSASESRERVSVLEQSILAEVVMKRGYRLGGQLSSRGDLHQVSTIYGTRPDRRK